MNAMHPDRKAVDLELQQCHIRLFIPLPILFAWYIFWTVKGHPDAIKGLMVAGAFLTFALVHWFRVKRNPGPHPSRQFTAIAVDQTACTAGMILTGELGAIIAFVNLWVSLGNGIRFGVKWMALSASFAALGLVGVGLISDYWAQHPIWISSLVLLNIAIPAYVASLIRGFHESRTRLSQYADEMEQMALKDALTGLPNRHALFEQLHRAIAHACRDGMSMAVLYFDLDGFKQVNDALGHAHGDLLLQETARRVKSTLRGQDVLGRWGGDEFVVLLQIEDSGKQARVAADRIRHAISSIEDLGTRPVEVTASVGIVIVGGEDAAILSAEQIVHEADRNMYAAKKQGKNRVVLSAFSSGLHLAARSA
jgi:diguanylate cyclase (GGDEF)-like protein